MQRDMEILLQGGAFKQLVKTRLKALQEKYDLKKTELLILLYLSKSESHTAKEIQQDMQMNKGHLSSLLDSLCQKKYVHATTDANDHRYVHYELEKKSDQVLEEINGLFYKLEQEMFCGISEEELRLFANVSKKISDNLKHML